MKKRAAIILHGMVQDAGFRGKIMRTAYSAGLVGYVENLPNGTVKAVCEGEEVPLKKFLKTLGIHKGDVDVKKIDVEWSKATNEFQGFYVKYTDLGMEMFQGFSTAGKKFDTMNDNLTRMDTRLGSMDKSMGRVDNRMGNIETSFSDALVRYDVFGKKMTSMEGNMEQLTKQITRFVDHMVGEETKPKRRKTIKKLPR